MYIVFKIIHCEWKYTHFVKLHILCLQYQSSFFRVPIGQFYTWLNFFTQPAVVMVVTNIRYDCWSSFKFLFLLENCQISPRTLGQWTFPPQFPIQHLEYLECPDFTKFPPNTRSMNLLSSHSVNNISLKCTNLPFFFSKYQTNPQRLSSKWL